MNLAELERSGSHSNVNTFYVSFSDLLLLMLVFFVLVVGMSKVDVGSFEQLRAGVTGSTKGTLVELAEKLKTLAKDQPGVSVELAADGVRLDLDSRALFDTGSSALKFNAIEPLRPLLREILQTRYAIDVEGHSDDRAFFRKIGEEIETNWSLSGKRAASVLHVLLEYGFQRSRLRIVGYASTRPRASLSGRSGDALEAARRQNRRVTLLVK